MTGSNSSAGLSAASLFFMAMGSLDHSISIPLNGWAARLIVSGKRSLVESEVLTLNLLVTEAVFSHFFFLTLLGSFGRLPSLNPLIKCYQGMTVVGRALFHSQVCLDRYLAVLHPVVFIRYKHIQYRSLCLAAVWLLVILCGLCNVYTTSQATLLAMSSGAFLVPALVIQLFCSLSIMRVLRRPGPGEPAAQERKEGNRQKIRAMKIICTTLVTLAVNTVPFISVPLVYGVFPNKEMLTFAFTLATAGSWVQGLLFLGRSGKVPKMLQGYNHYFKKEKTCTPKATGVKSMKL